MSGGAHPESGLSKSVWSDADFQEMGWHDATVHGLYVQETEDVLPRLLFDLDYIVRWVHPAPGEEHFSFWISPATLVFEGVWDLEGDLGFKGGVPDLLMDALRRLEPDDEHRNLPLWHVQGHAFDLRFRASGYRQYLRRAPRLMSRLSLLPEERGGCSFDEVGFD